MVSLVLAMGFTSTPIRALAGEPEVELVSVVYAAETSCPSEEGFLQNVRRYTTKWRAADASSSARLRSFRVVIEQQGTEHRGTLIIETPAGRRTQRRITAPDCDRVARGLAISMALAIDPEAQISELPPKSAVESEPVAVASEPAPSPPHPPSAPSPPPPTPEATRRGVGAPPPTRRPRVTFVLDGRVELTSLLARSVAPVFGAAFEVRAAPAGVPEWLSPAAALGLRQSLLFTVSSTAGSAELVWTAANLRLCPVRLRFASDRLEAVPCVEANGGVLQAEARATTTAQRMGTPWVDVGASGRVVYRIARSWSVGAAVLVSAPYVRHRFAFVERGLVSQAPAVGITGGLLAELRF